MSELPRTVDSEVATSLPSLCDKLVLSRIWPLFHYRVNMSLLWRLRQVNRAWKDCVGGTLEWVALDIVQVDSPCLHLYLLKRGERCPSLRERVESEFMSFKLFFSERLENFEVHAMTGSGEDGDNHPSDTSVSSGEKRDVWDRRSARKLC